MKSSSNVLVAALALFAIGACGASSKADTTPADSTESHAMHAADHDMAGHGGHHAMPAASAEPSAAAKAPGEAQVGDETTCPVSGREFTVTAESASVEHEGKTYYFCCPGCDTRFQADPAKYVTN